MPRDFSRPSDSVAARTAGASEPEGSRDHFSTVRRFRLVAAEVDRRAWPSCAAIALGFYFYHRLDDEVRRTVEAKLGEKYPHLQVAVREAQLVRGEGIRVRGLSIVEPNRAGSARRAASSSTSSSSIAAPTRAI